MIKKNSDINVTPVKHQNGLIGFASLIIDKSLYLGSIVIFTRPNGNLRLVYPTKKFLNKSLNIYHPINKETSDFIEKEVIAKFEALLAI